MPDAGHVRRGPARQSTAAATEASARFEALPLMISERGASAYPNNERPLPARCPRQASIRFAGIPCTRPLCTNVMLLTWNPSPRLSNLTPFPFGRILISETGRISPRPSLERHATSAFMSATGINGKGLSVPSSVMNAVPPVMLSMVARKPYPLLLAANQRLFASPQAAVMMIQPFCISA